MSELMYVHVSANLTVNNNTYSWSEPCATSNISFEMPIDLFDGSKLAKLFEARIKELLGEFPDRVAEYEMKKAQKEAESGLGITFAKGEGG